MSKLEQAARQAMEFIEYHSKHWNGIGTHPQVITANLREALEQPTEKPYAVARVDDLERGGRVRALAMGLSLDAPLYTHPQPAAWVGLTAVDRKEIERQSVYVDGAIRMTEALLREKNGGAA